MLPVEQVKKMSVSEVPPPLLDLSEERVPNKEAIHSREAKGTMLTEKAGFFPPVEKLDLRERRRSAEPPEDWPSEEEIRRFWKLRQEIVESQQAEVLERQRLPAELPPALTAVLSDKEKRRPRPRPVFRTRTPSFKSVLPELAPWQQAQGRTSLPEESISPDGAAQEVASKIPFATDLIGNEKIPMHSPGKLKQSKEKSLQASQEMSAFREENLAEKRKQHSQQLQGRRSRF